MKTILKKQEIDNMNINFKNEFMIRNHISQSNNKWFKGSRNRGIR